MYYLVKSLVLVGGLLKPPSIPYLCICLYIVTIRISGVMSTDLAKVIYMILNMLVETFIYYFNIQLI